jgi:hypothetical protein
LESGDASPPDGSLTPEGIRDMSGQARLGEVVIDADAPFPVTEWSNYP